MAFLALNPTDILHRYAVHLTSLDIVMELLVNAVEFVAGAVIVVKVNLCFAVTVDTPAHA